MLDERILTGIPLIYITLPLSELEITRIAWRG